MLLAPNLALGTGRFEVPGFLLEGQDSFDAAGWKATSESIQVLRVGYRFGQANANGVVLDAIVINASVGSMTIEPPLGKRIERLKADSIWPSIDTSRIWRRS